MKHSELNIAIDKIISENSDRYSHADLAAAYQHLQATYAGLKIPAGAEKASQLLQGEAEHLAYLLTRMPATYAVASRVFNEFFLMDYPEKIASLLDLGSGTGSILWAAMERGLKTVTAVDQSSRMIELAKKLAIHNNDVFWRDVIWQQGNLTEKIDFPQPHPSKHDLVTLSYVLVEHDLTKQEQILEQAWSLAQHAIIIIEPGTPKGFSHCLAARDFFIKRGAFIPAPCSHHGVCPIKGKDWCHFSERIERSFWQKSFKKGVLGYEDEAYSYLMVTKKPLVRRSYRILKKPAKKSSHILLELCAPNDVKKATVSKKQGELFKSTKKVGWGDCIEI